MFPGSRLEGSCSFDRIRRDCGPWGAESGVAVSGVLVKKFATFAFATIVALMGLGAAGAGVASASPVLSLDQSTGLTDGQLVTITVSGLTMSSQATVEISECGNAYADNTALPVVNMTASSPRL